MYGLIGKITAVQGKRDELMTALIAGFALRAETTPSPASVPKPSDRF